MTTPKKPTGTASRRGKYSYEMLLSEWKLPYTNDKWMKDASCKKHDPKIFFPDRGANGAHFKAQKICSECKVRTDCLRYAIKNSIPYGVWGGTTPNERKRNRVKLMLEIGEDGDK